uniref:T-complex protein 1 subunit delta n=1 Tax=Stygiella incarcerata TaxID=1712417 RepID=A0A192ZI76_9EUKA|nr:T-complex protein 1 subunit delta [Stygiella incarcerata]|eukprot:TRINITY_DN81635_c0_g1_i1.p1 TRINITY_DN81635_c0_g1~~TRINITY_DN81635_c0_g1_i1.p1  ORF type:complete len:538 (-),score=171.71 TRINITY_DN81635_c0_g1_i1:326-1939(-)
MERKPVQKKPTTKGLSGERYREEEKQKDVRMSNIIAAKAVSDAIRTSLGPRGMDKMILESGGDVVVTNDGATILRSLEVIHPTAKMLVELSHAQDVEAGDGTTSVVVIAGALLSSCLGLMERGIHPSKISEAFQLAADKAEEILVDMGKPVDLDDRESLIKAASTSLQSKVVAQHADVLAPIAVDSVLKIANLSGPVPSVDLRDIRIVKKLGGTLDDTQLIDGFLFPQKATRLANGPTRIENAKIGLIQFCLSPPKSDLEHNVVIRDYQQMDRAFTDERKYLLTMCQKIKKTGCNVLLIQKSILQDAVTDLSLHFLAQMKIMVVRDIERDDIEFVAKSVGCTPAAHIDFFTTEKLGEAEKVEEISTPDGRVTKVTGLKYPHKTVSVLIRGTNKHVLDEADRSLHDALCVVRSIVKKKFLICGGGAPEMEVSKGLLTYAKTQPGLRSYCIRAFAEALEVIPYTLAENAGLSPVAIVTELRKRHAEGEKTMGINIKKGTISDMGDESVVQPLLVNLSAIRLATETVRMILKIDDIVLVR